MFASNNKFRKVCIVNNYNYARFLGAALESVRSQTIPFDLILIVDDGSADESPDLIRRFCAETSTAKAIFKANGGQLSCFNEVVRYIEKSDLVTFLDADDVYPANYLEQLEKKAKTHRVSFYFCEPVEFSDPASVPSDACITVQEDFVLPCTSALARRYSAWIGSPTSCVAVSGALFLKVFPYPHESDWVTRADDVLVYAASLLGEAKAHLPSLGIGYRVHGANSYFGKHYDKRYEVVRRHKLERLFGWYCHQQHIATEAARDAAIDELWLMPEDRLKRFNLPARRSALSWRKRMRYEMRLRRHARAVD